MQLKALRGMLHLLTFDITARQRYRILKSPSEVIGIVF